jgi:hypothetical protein
LLLGHLNGLIQEGFGKNNDLSALKATTQSSSGKIQFLSASKTLKSHRHS